MVTIVCFYKYNELNRTQEITHREQKNSKVNYQDMNDLLFGLLMSLLIILIFTIGFDFFHDNFPWQTWYNSNVFKSPITQYLTRKSSHSKLISLISITIITNITMSLDISLLFKWTCFEMFSTMALKKLMW